MTSGYVPVSLQRRVRQRATQRCEYCRLSQAGQEATFHIDHVRPRRDGGGTRAENLALACVSCSLRKAGTSRWSAKLAGRYTLTRQTRQDSTSGYDLLSELPTRGETLGTGPEAGR
ncbi:MAG: HNH endonuclease [Armatimonadetes bacterium]|nr:HNH endonuclease [Armatimonadota bacterium]